MLRKTLLATAALIGIGSGAVVPRMTPDLNALLQPNDAQLLQIQKAAGGLLPNGKITKLSAVAQANLAVIAINEQFEVAYFASLIGNITSGVHGYSPGDLPSPMSTGRLLETLNAIVNVGVRAIYPNSYHH